MLQSWGAEYFRVKSISDIPILSGSDDDKPHDYARAMGADDAARWAYSFL